MSNDYESETCEGCTWLHKLRCCHESREDASGYVHWTDDRCEYFAPSLQCRQVRALERIGKAITPIWMGKPVF
jgi:hypothetical protein